MCVCVCVLCPLLQKHFPFSQLQGTTVAVSVQQQQCVCAPWSFRAQFTQAKQTLCEMIMGILTHPPSACCSLHTALWKQESLAWGMFLYCSVGKTTHRNFTVVSWCCSFYLLTNAKITFSPLLITFSSVPQLALKPWKPHWYLYLLAIRFHFYLITYSV